MEKSGENERSIIALDSLNKSNLFADSELLPRLNKFDQIVLSLLPSNQSEREFEIKLLCKVN